MVEFALVLPVLLLLLVMAVDFGRVFYGWVALNNATRIAADRAAHVPDAWPADDPIETGQQTLYQAVVNGDLRSINCTAPGTIPDPSFPAGKDDGDPAVVELSCSFSLLTPLANGILGGGVALSAESQFAINRVVAGNPPPPTTGGPPPPVPTCAATEARVPNLVTMKMEDAKDAWIGAGFSGAFSPAVTNPNKNRNVLTQVVNPTTAVDACAPKTATVTVTHS
jgi:hypothetical protein